MTCSRHAQKRHSASNWSQNAPGFDAILTLPCVSYGTIAFVSVSTMISTAKISAMMFIRQVNSGPRKIQ